MATIDLKLKSYDELSFEIMRLNTDNYLKQQELDRLNNDIKTLLKENEAKEKVIKKQNNIIDEVRKWVDNHTILVYTRKAPRQLVGLYELLQILYDKDKLKELKENK